jgi:hypothetical protein
MIHYKTNTKMSSIVSFFRNMFSDKVETPKPLSLSTRDKWVILNPSAAEVLQIDIENDLCNVSRNLYDASSMLSPLHPLNMKCGYDSGMTMMCLNL